MSQDDGETLDNPGRAGLEKVLPLLSYVALFLIVTWLPVNKEWRISDMGVSTPDLQQVVSIFFFDLPAIALAIVTLGIVFRAERRIPKGPIAIAAASLILLVTLSLLLDPSARGVQTVLRVLEAALLAFVVARLARGDDIKTVAGGFIGVACLEAALGLSQVIRGQTLGLTGLGENPPLTAFGESLSAKGTFVHHYIFGAYLLVAAAAAIAMAMRTGKKLWLLPLPLLAAGFGFTYSRTGAIAIVLAVGVLVIHGWVRDRFLILAAAFLLMGTGISMIASPDGWLLRVRQTVGTEKIPGVSRLDSVSTERIILIRQAGEMISEEPLTGIGAGFYSFALAEQLGQPRDSEIEFKPVHNVPILIAAESGIPAGVVTLTLLALLGFAAWRGGPDAQVLYVIYLPFLMLDHFPYDAPMGLALTGLWAGTILWLKKDRARDGEPV